MALEDFIKFKDLNNKDKVMLVLLALASVVLVAILLSNYMKTGKPVDIRDVLKKEAVSTKEAKEVEKTMPKKKNPIEIQVMLKEVGRSDPFLPADKKGVYKGAVAGQLVLTGITKDTSGKRLAIINNALVSEGDILGSKKVVKITDDKVVVSDDGIEQTLTLHRLLP